MLLGNELAVGHGPTGSVTNGAGHAPRGDPPAWRDRDWLRSLESRAERLRADADLTLNRQNGRVLVLRSGWVFRYRRLADGRRHILGFHVPGECLGLSAVLGPQAAWNLRTVTRAEFGVIEADRLAQACRTIPGLAAAVAAQALAEQERLVEQLVCLGQFTAYERMARLLTDLSRRLHAAGLADGRSFDLPVTQAEMADHLGLSPVHVNRVLKQLRRDGLVSIERHHAVLLNPTGLAEAAGLS